VPLAAEDIACSWNGATKNPARFPGAHRVYPVCALEKKPIPGKPGIGAQFAIFNFVSKLIWAV